MSEEKQVLVRHGCAAALLWAAALGAQQPATEAIEPAVQPDHRVTFHYAAPDATADARVSLSLEGVKEPLAMVRDQAGGWSYTTAALKPELYYYHFEVNGRPVLDPGNMEIVHSLTAVANSFLVPGATPQPWEDAAIAHGTVHRHVYTSKVVRGLAQAQSEFYVYTPAGYGAAGRDAASRDRYPVLYLLHGWSHVAGDWTGIGRANEILDAEIASGKARPMIVVMPLGYGDMEFVQHGMAVWNDGEQVERNTALFTQALLGEVMPQVDRLYRTAPGRENRAIAGLSMGGLESLTVGLGHPELFAYVGGMSAAVHLANAVKGIPQDANKAAMKLVWIACGSDDELYPANQRLAERLKQAGYPVRLDETVGGVHTWIVWRQNLVDLSQLLFRQERPAAAR